MKTYRIYAAFALLTLTALPASGQFQPGEPLQPHQECGFDYECFKQKSAEEDALRVNEIERQEVEEVKEVEPENKRIEELKRNAEQPGLN